MEAVRRAATFMLIAFPSFAVACGIAGALLYVGGAHMLGGALLAGAATGVLAILAVAFARIAAVCIEDLRRRQR